MPGLEIKVLVWNAPVDEGLLPIVGRLEHAACHLTEEAADFHSIFTHVLYERQGERAVGAGSIERYAAVARRVKHDLAMCRLDGGQPWGTVPVK